MSRFSLLGHYNPAGKYPAFVVPVGRDESGRVVLGYISGAVTVDERIISFVRHPSELPFSPSDDQLFATAKEKVRIVSRENVKKFCLEMFASGFLNACDPFLAIAIATQARDKTVFRQVIRNGLLEIGYNNKFAQSWYAAERSRSRTSEKWLPTDLTSLFEDKPIARIACSLDALPLCRAACRWLNNASSQHHEVSWVAAYPFDLSDRIDSSVEIAIVDPVTTEVLSERQTPLMTAFLGTAEPVLAVNPTFAREIPSTKGWADFLISITKVPGFSWIRPRSLTPVGRMVDLGIEEELQAAEDRLPLPLYELVAALEERVRSHAPTDSEALPEAFNSQRWQVGAVAALRHSCMAAFADVKEELQPILLSSSKAKLPVEYKALLVSGLAHVRNAFNRLGEFFLSQDGKSLVDGFGFSSEHLSVEFVQSRAVLAEAASLRTLSFQRPVMLWVALDVSGSMAGQKLDQAKLGVILLLGRLQAGRGDHAGLLTFSDTVTVEVELDPIANVFDQIVNRVSSLSAHGQTSLVDGIMTALKKLPRPNGVIQAVVVLTDGRENNSKSTTDDIFSTLATFVPEGPSVHCLSYGDDADKELLNLIARASRGAAYTGSYSSIEELFKRIGYHF